jgi:2-dehydropantoate 2-reductase
VFARLRDEAIACFTAAGIAWTRDSDFQERQQALSPLGDIGGHARQGGSSWQSLARHAGNIEADFLNGEIALLGRLHGVATPANAALQAIAARMAREGIAPGSLTLAEVTAAIDRA